MLAIVIIGTFLLLELAPGDAVDAYIVSTGGDAGMIELLRHRWGLDQSELTRLANYLWALLHLDLGQSVTFSRPIRDVILERLPNTLLLMGSATALSFGVGSALGFIYLALYLRMMRAGMAEVWRQDFVLAARAKGLSRRRIVLAHVARNALLPLVTMLGLQSAQMLGGSVVIESVFAVPGLGRLAQEAVAARDTPLLLGIILVSAVMVIVINLLVDIAYAFLDPRVGASEAGA